MTALIKTEEFRCGQCSQMRETTVGHEHTVALATDGKLAPPIRMCCVCFDDLTRLIRPPCAARADRPARPAPTAIPSSGDRRA